MISQVLAEPANKSESLVKRKSVLIVEDSRLQSAVLRKRLELAGYSVLSAENGVIALEIAQQSHPSIIVSDIQMPLMNGCELCQKLKSDPVLQDTPVILLSTLESPKDIIEGLNAGADDYIAKPYDTRALIAKIEALQNDSSAFNNDKPQNDAMEVNLGDETFHIKADHRQAIRLLVSTFENAVEQNKRLRNVNDQLTQLKEQLTNTNTELRAANEHLHELNSRMASDLQAAARLQQSLLPSEAIASDHFSVAWNYKPCEELAGDFLNFALLDEYHLAVYVADVSGHGAASSLLSVAIGRVLSSGLSATSLLARLDPFSGKPVFTPPATVVAELNRRFPMESNGGLHFTILYGIIDLKTKQFRYACGGHPPPIHMRPGQKSRLAEGDGFAVGWIEDAEFDEFLVQLAPGDRILLYSDGVPEAMDRNLEQLTNDRLLKMLDDTSERPIEAQVEAINDLVTEWCQPQGLRDDVSILMIEIK